MFKRLSVIFLLNILCFSCKKKEEQNYFYKNLEREKKEQLFFNIGKVYFKNNCNGCHRKGGTDNFLEFTIKEDKYEFEFLKAFITNQDSLIKSGNEEEFNNLAYRHKFDLKNNEVKAIIYYLKK